MGKPFIQSLEGQQGNLTDEEEAKLREEAISELDEELTPKGNDSEGEDGGEDAGHDDEDAGDKKGEEGEDENAGDDKAGDDEETPEEKAAKEAVARKEALDAALAKKEEERTDEEKALVKANDDEQKRLDEEAFKKEAEEYADQENVPLKVAKERIAKIRDTVKKFEGDPKKIAKALYHTQAAWARSQNELKAIQSAPKNGEIRVNIDGKLIALEEEPAKSQAIAMFREKKPELTQDLDDEKVFALAKEIIVENRKRLIEKRTADIRTAAEKKREEVLSGIDESDKPFLEDVKKALSQVSDQEILDEEFSPLDYVFWARGKQYHKAVADAEKRGYERGMQEKKILGKSSGGSASGSSPKKKEGSGGGLTEEQKKEALKMFEEQDISEERKFELYADFLKDEETPKKSKK